MIKYVCDRCGRDITGTHPGYIAVNWRNVATGELTSDNPYENCHYCASCMNLLRAFLTAREPAADSKTACMVTEGTGMESKQQQKTEGPDKQNRAGSEDKKTRRKIDVGKIMALKRAGWGNKDIAEEMDMVPQDIANIIYRQKKKFETQKSVKGD